MKVMVLRFEYDPDALDPQTVVDEFGAVAAELGVKAFENVTLKLASLAPAIREWAEDDEAGYWEAVPLLVEELEPALVDVTLTREAAAQWRQEREAA